ncbi:MAG: DUF4115 domain-containing protein [Rhodobacteraceae bacterium]|nr:DUF4115 domain-containing protein [Paracoccaceae bacterium]
MTRTDKDMADVQGFDSFELRLGDELRGERATLGKSLLDVQRDLRIKASYIAAIENCDLSVFKNTGFLAGYVRSYARYLELDPEATYARFCAESNFKGAHADLGRQRKGADKARVAAISASAINDFNPVFGGGTAQRSRILDLSAFAPLLVMLALIAALIFGGWTLLKDIQRVDIAPVEQSPVVLDSVEMAGFAEGLDSAALARSSEQAMDMNRLYSNRALSVPVVTPRDGPIFDINKQMASSFSVPVVPQTGALQATTLTVEGANPAAEIGEPVVRVARAEPLISIFAQREAWVRVSAADGSVLFEKILAPGEEYTLPARSELATLRAGNADWLFLMVDGQVFGPLKGVNSVASNVSLTAANITDSYPPLGTLTAEMQVVSEDLTRAAALETE